MALDMSQLGESVVDPFVVFWNSVVYYLPGIVAAILILILGYFVAAIVGFIIRKVIDKTKLDDYLIKMKFEKPEALGGLRLAKVVGRLIKWWVFILFLTPAADVLALPRLSAILTALALWAPHLIAAILIMIVGLLAAEFLANVATSAKRLKGIKAVGSVIRVFVIIFFLNIALKEIGINIVLAETTFLMLIAGFILIFVIGFGVGLIKPAEKLIEKWMKKLK